MATRLIVDIHGEIYHVEGRAAVMIAFLAEHQARVNVAEKGDVTFHYGGSEVTPKITAIDACLEV